MRRRNDQAQVPTRNDDGHLTLSLIADWTESDVWDYLAMFLESEIAPFPTFAQGGTIRRMLDLYRDGNEGTCGMFLTDGKKAPCGSRFGCWTCTITGDKDRSMESMLNSDPKYEYMRGLSDFRNFLVSTQWDMNRRELVGRKISEAGYLPVRPDVYNLTMRQQLLRYILTLDELERERAEILDADLITGKAVDSPENQRLRYPQFEHINIEDIVLIDFMWGMHHYASSAYPALQVWYDIKVLGRRYTTPRLAKTEPHTIPPKRWFFVGAFNSQVPTDGLRDYKAEQWNRYLHPHRPLVNREIHGERIVWHEEEETLRVDSLEASLFIDTYCQGPLAIESQTYSAIESTRFWLNQEIVKLPRGMASRYQYMAKRGQYFAHLSERLNITPSEMDEYLQANSIGDSDHEVLLGHVAAAAEQTSQLDLWAA
jgi:DNA sulfur modification protein DndC